MIQFLRRIRNKMTFNNQLNVQKRRKLNIGSAGVNSSNDWIPTDIDILDITDASAEIIR
jgi:hypothetical protein